MLPTRTASPPNVRIRPRLTMLPIAWITCCFLLGALVGTINKAGTGPFMVLARRAYSTSISPRTIHPQIAPYVPVVSPCMRQYPSILTVCDCSPIGLPTLTGRVGGPIWTSGSHAVDAKATHIAVHHASYDVYSMRPHSWLTTDRASSTLVPIIGGVCVLLAVLVYLVCTSNSSSSKLAVCRPLLHRVYTGG